MAQYLKITDDDIDDVIKSAGAYDPTLNLTQGFKLRKLLKEMRDGIESDPTPITLIGGTNIQITSDENSSVIGINQGRNPNQVVARNENGDILVGRLAILGANNAAGDDLSVGTAIQLVDSFEGNTISKGARLQLGNHGDILFKTFSGPGDSTGSWFDRLRITNQNGTLDYSADVSANYNDRSLVDRQYVDSKLGGGPVLIPVTYTQLVNLLNSSSLVAGQQYLLTDFQSTFVYTEYKVEHFDWNPAYASLNYTNDVYSGAIEPLVLTAMTVNTLSTFAKSTVYPNDEILYSFQNKNSGILSSTKGTILSREDKKMLAYANFDWREVKYKYTDETTGQVISARAVNFGLNEWGISNSKVFAYGTYGVVGPIVIGSLLNSTVSTSPYRNIVLGSVNNSLITGGYMVNKLCDISNSQLYEAVNYYQTHHDVSFNGLDIKFITGQCLNDDQFDQLADNGVNVNTRYTVLEGPSENGYMPIFYKQYIDKSGIFHTVPFQGNEV